MERYDTATPPRNELVSRLISELKIIGPITLVGPHSIGKSYMLDRIAETLIAAGRTPIRISPESTVDEVNLIGPGDIYLMDQTEAATPEILEAIAERGLAGAHGIAAFGPEPESGAYARTIDRISEGQPEVGEWLSRARSFRVASLTTLDALDIAREAGTVLDSVTMQAAIALSWGRPGWLLDLLTLAAAGKLRSDPFPSIVRLDAADTHLPSLQRAATIINSLTDNDHVAAAIVLAELEPRSMAGAADLVGEDAVEAMNEARILLRVRSDQRPFAVPELYSAMLRQRHSTFEGRAVRHAAAIRLIDQRAAGIPLTERDEWFCARIPLSVAQRNLAANAKVRTSLLAAARTLIVFGDPEVREIMLRAQVQAPISTLDQARISAVVLGPHAALHILPPSQDPEFAAPEEFLRALLRSELGIDQFPQASSTDTARVSMLWNRSMPLEPDDIDLLQRASADREQPIAAMLAEQLLELAGVIRGLRLASFSETSRTRQLTTLALDNDPRWDDLLATAAVTDAVISLFTWHSSEAAMPLRDTVPWFPGAAFHMLWIQHIHSARMALSVGNHERAALEWSHLDKRLPRFLPARLQSTIAAIGEALASAPDSQLPPVADGDHTRQAAHKIIDYFRGNFAGLDFELEPESVRLANYLEAPRSGFAAAAEQHLRATKQQNPSALLKASEELKRRGLWAPAAYAIKEAKDIFMRRRAAGSVSKCNGLLETLDAQAQKFAPSFSSAGLGPSRTLQLTDRELEAARLAVEGLSNREIAAQLMSSTRTAESHVANARAKLGASNRSELGQRMRDLGIE